MKVLPNPANNSLTIAYDLSKTASVATKIFDWTGRLIADKTENSLKGYHQAKWNTSDYPNGLYFIVMTINGESSAHKVVIVH